MNQRYKIVADYHLQLTLNPFDDPWHPGTPHFKYGRNQVELKIKPQKEIKKSVFTGDVEVYLNGKRLDTFKNRMLESVTNHENEPPEFLPPSADDVSVFAVTDSKTKESHVFILAEISDYEIRNENELHYKYYRDGMKEMLTFRLWKVREDGTCTKEEFGYKGGRTDLQTFLVQYAGHPVGRYTDLLFAWPSFNFSNPLSLCYRINRLDSHFLWCANKAVFTLDLLFLYTI